MLSGERGCLRRSEQVQLCLFDMLCYNRVHCETQPDGSDVNEFMERYLGASTRNLGSLTEMKPVYDIIGCYFHPRDTKRFARVFAESYADRYIDEVIINASGEEIIQHLYEQPLTERKQRLRTLFPTSEEAGIRVVEGRVLEKASQQELAELVQESVDAGCEGLVLKRINGAYPFGCRNSRCGGSG